MARVTFPALVIALVVIALVVMVKAAPESVTSSPVRPAPVMSVTPTAVPSPTPVSTYTHGRSLCTGSMEPAVGCLDKVLYQDNVEPADVLVGSIISVESCGKRFTHRVVEIVDTGGQRYYRTKGDALQQVDNCWIRHGDVYGLMVSVEKNVEMANAELRDAVNSAKARLLASPDDPDAIAAYHCWRRAAKTSKFPGHIPHRCEE